MKNKKLIIAYLIPLLLFAGMAFASPVSNLFRNLLPETSNTYDLGTTTARWVTFYDATSTENVINTGTLTATTSITTNNLTINGTCTGCSGNPNLIYTTIGTTKYYTASSTATDNLAWLFKNGFVSNASSSIVSLQYGNATGTTEYLSGALSVNAASSTITQLTVSTLTLGSALTVPNGGTGAGTFTSNGVLYGNGTGALNVTAQGGTNSVLWANAGTPSFTTSPTTTNLTATGNLNVTGSSTFSNLVTIGGSASTTGSFNVGGNITDFSATNTISNLSVSTLVRNTYKSFTVASTTLLTGTTTIPLGTAIVKETWNQVICRTDTGTADLIFYNSGNVINAGTGITRIPASTASSTVSFTAGNALPALTNRKVDIGNLVSTPNYISCSLDITQNQ